KFAHTLAGTIADERRHVGFGENRIGGWIRQHPERKAEIERLQRDMSYHMLATFAEAFRDAPSPEDVTRFPRPIGQNGPKPSAWQGRRIDGLPPEEMEQLLADTVLKEFKLRLERIGLEYQTPVRP